MEKNTVAKNINRKYGTDVCQDVSFLLEREQKVVRVSPSLDIGLSGGIPEGSWVMVSGKEKCGKSSTALTIIANAQKLNKHCYYLDVEGRIKKMNIKGTNNIQSDKLTVISSQEGKILDAEDYLSIAEEIIKDHPGCVLVIDSASALSSLADKVADYKKQNRPTVPRLYAMFCKRNSNIIPVQRTIVISIHHLAQQQGSHITYWSEDGGQKIKYQKDIHLRAKTFEHWPKNTNKPIGQKITWDIVCSALGPPCSKIDSYLRYGWGLDEEMELINLGLDLGFISKGGAGWMTLDFIESDEPIKAQGVEKAANTLRDNPKNKDLLYDKILSVLS